MKPHPSLYLFLFAFLVSNLDQRLHAQEGLQLGIKAQGPQLELRWQSKLPLPLSTSTAQYEVQRSDDLIHWQTLGSPVMGRMGVSDELLRAGVAPDQPQSYYRLVGRVHGGAAPATGAEVFGYGTAFAQELQRLGQISVGEFTSRYAPEPSYLPALTWDPTTAQFWDGFNRLAGFRLNAEELDLFKRNGFVVSERLGDYSFANAYYRIFSGDLPVLVTTDSILQAWHFSYQAMLLELELTYLSSVMDQILNGMAAQTLTCWQKYGGGALRDSILDADYFVTVARSLLAGKTVASPLGQQERVSTTLAAIAGEELVPCFDLFGAPRDMDFSQFKVRGHYESNPVLRRYFKCLMWLGRTDLRVAGGPYQDCAAEAPHPAPLRELGTAVVLQQWLSAAGQFENWWRFDQVIQAFVGWTDSLTVGQLGALLRAAKLRSLADVPNLAVLQQLQQDLEAGRVGVQQITSDYLYSPLGPAQVKLPVSFTFAGQRFVVDSWALSKVVFDEVIWDTDGVLTLEDKLPRRKPSALDVAFTVLGNNQIVPDLVARIGTLDGLKFRDGLFYQHNLAAVRQVIDRQDSAVWRKNMYFHWLGSLRQLSTPTTDSRYPECMRTRAWAMKTLNTQIASWTQLRHDTILYAKQSYTPPIACSYPNGYVEPRTEFWGRSAETARATADLLASLPLAGPVVIQPDEGMPTQTTLENIQAQQLAFLNSFAATLDRLGAIAQKELAQQPLTTLEASFLKDLMESAQFQYVKTKQYTGWYPSLFYKNVLENLGYGENEGSDKWDPLVADVHTDTPDALHGDPGGVLHEAVGNVHLLMVAVDCGSDRMVYAGPVLSHFEFEMPASVRKSDSEWKTELKQGEHPAHPDWTGSYLVHGPNAVPSQIR